MPFAPVLGLPQTLGSRSSSNVSKLSVRDGFRGSRILDRRDDAAIERVFREGACPVRVDVV
jgi:hypothetical protein